MTAEWPFDHTDEYTLVLKFFVRALHAAHDGLLIRRKMTDRKAT